MTPLRLLAIIEACVITGPAKNLIEFARLGHEAGIATTIATFTRSAGSNLFIDTARAHGIPVELIPERGAYDRETIAALRRLVARLRPDVVQTHAVKSHFLARLAGVSEVAPWAAFHHGYTWPDWKARAYNQLDRWSLRAPQQVLTVSAPFRDELVARGVEPGRIEIIHNAIPLQWGARAREAEAAAALREELGIAPNRQVILIVGRLSREKDHLTLLEAVHRVRRQAPEVAPHVVIVGEGPEQPRIEERIRSLNLGDSVTFTGHRKSAEPYYGIANLAVLSSLSEGSPNALLEAMVTGVPVVATAVGGIPEIVRHGESALLVQPGDAEAMGGAMLRLLTDPEMAGGFARRGEALIRERHTPELRVGKLAGIYRSMSRVR